MNIGFDLDRVLINYPPIIPAQIIDWFYRNHNQKYLSYSIPHSPFSIFFRRLTHFSFLRPAIAKNVKFVQDLSKNHNNHSLYLISSRYGFLKHLTLALLNKYNLTNCFHSLNLNTKNEQPHLFKTKIIQKLKIDVYIDDDLDLLKYLRQYCPKTKFIWYNPSSSGKPEEEIPMITELDEVKKYLK